MTGKITRIAVRILVASLAAHIVPGCRNQKDTALTKSAGAWSDTVYFHTSGDTTLQFTGGAKAQVITIVAMGDTGMVRAVTIIGTASGNTLTFPALTLADACGGTYSVSARGTISGNTLTYTIRASGVAMDKCIFTDPD